jgi:hypothetical protein
MSFFEEATLRLKQQLGVSYDKQVAKALSLSESAWKKRKERGIFPEKELWALAAQQPDLNLDVDYVLTGITREAHARLAANQAAGERARRYGGDFRAGWEASDRDMEIIQKALNADRQEFLALVRTWSRLSAEERKVFLCAMSAMTNRTTC